MIKFRFIYLFAFAIILFSCENEPGEVHIPDRFIEPVFDSVEIIRDIHYKTALTTEGRKEELFFDFYEPFGDSSNLRPLVIMIHGGGFFQGKKSWMDPLGILLGKYGYSCASISYRLYDGDNFPLDNETFIKSFLLAREDLISAVEYFVSHASGIDPYKTDTRNIFLAGSSAGAITALHAADLPLSDNHDNELYNLIREALEDSHISKLKGPGVQINGVLSFSGAIFDLNWINPGFPNVFCVHGKMDKIVPFGEGYIKIHEYISPIKAFGSLSIYQHCLDQGIKAEIILDEASGHDNFFKKQELWHQAVIDYLYGSLKKE